MHTPANAYQPRAAKTPGERYAGFAFVGILHLALIYALINGLAVRVFQKIAPRIEMRVLQPEATQPPDKQPIPAAPKITLTQPDTIPKPDIKFDRPSAAPSQVRQADDPSTAQDRAASALGATHSVPPYPLLARRLGHQGRVTLRLTISPSGRVERAEIVGSSGWPDLDARAADWVRSHWRYQPAIRGGVAVPSQTMAAVRFDLRSAR
jgi:protein TonB